MDTSLKRLPDMDYEFEISIIGGFTRTQYDGKFKFRIPDIKTRAKADIERARLNQIPENLLDETTSSFHTMHAYLKHTLIEAPAWWKASDSGYTLRDGNVTTAVYLKVQEFERNWTQQVWGPNEDQSGSNSENAAAKA